MDNWFLVYCKPQQEIRAQQNLSILGFDSYLPHVTWVKKRAGKMVGCKELLFPRYLFLRAKSEDNLAVVKNTRGVTDFVRFGGLIAKVPMELIETVTLQQIQFQRQCQQDSRFHHGDIVEICEGPFAGMSAVFQLAEGEQRSLVLIQLLNAATPLTLNNTQLRKKNAGPLTCNAPLMFSNTTV